MHDFRWVKGVKIKINCYVSRMIYNKISFASNLAARGIVLNALVCLRCGIEEENVGHIFSNVSSPFKSGIGFTGGVV